MAAGGPPGAPPGPPSGPDSDGDVIVEKKEKTSIPKRWRVIFHNDDYTTMDFVIQVLETVFERSPSEAYRIMLHVHQNGRGIAGSYPWEVAETKADKVVVLASEAGFPLQATVEEA